MFHCLSLRIPTIDFAVLKDEIGGVGDFRRENNLFGFGNPGIQIHKIPVISEIGIQPGGVMINLSIPGLYGQQNLTDQPTGVIEDIYPFSEIIEENLIFVKEQLIDFEPGDIIAQSPGSRDRFELCGVLLQLVFRRVVEPDHVTVRENGVFGHKIQVVAEGKAGDFIQVLIEDIKFLKIAVEGEKSQVCGEAGLADRDVKIIPVRRNIPIVVLHQRPAAAQNVGIVGLIHKDQLAPAGGGSDGCSATAAAREDHQEDHLQAAGDGRRIYRFHTYKDSSFLLSDKQKYHVPANRRY